MWALAVYVLWTLATYLLENCRDLYQRPTIGGRYAYVLIANVLFGTIGAAWVIRRLVNAGFVGFTQAGFRSAGRTLISVVIALIIGVLYVSYLLPASVPLLVIVNGYVQVLPVTIAEILVCWALIGATFESAVKPKSWALSLLVGIVAATILFSFYHIGHSAPFNQIKMMLFLLVPGIITSLFYFISREVYATILFHNFQGIIGVIGNLKNFEFLNRPLYPLYFLVLLSVAALVCADMLLVRRRN